MFFSSIKGINRLIGKKMSNIYSKAIVEKSLIFLVWKICLQVSFWGAPTQENIIEF